MDVTPTTTAARAPRRSSGAARLVRIGHLVWHRDEYRVYRYRLDELPAQPALPPGLLRRDWSADLDLYEPSSPWWLPKRTFLELAAQRMAAGEHVYTSVSGGRLLHYAWLADHCEDSLVQEVGQTCHYDIPGAVLYDAHTLPEARGRGLHTKSIAVRLRDARDLAGERWAYVGCLASNSVSRAVIEKCGFAYFTSLMRAHTLGVTMRWQTQRPS